jgi:hypothetical protein
LRNVIEAILITATAVGLCAYISFCTPQAKAQSSYVAVDDFKNAAFPDIPINSISDNIDDQSIEISVDKSKSFVVLPFSEPTKIKNLSFFWKFKGKFGTLSEDFEKSHMGNDNRLAIGLVMTGKRSWLDWLFSPEWMRVLEKEVEISFNEMILFNVGARAKPGTNWKDPEYKNVSHVSLADSPTHWEGNWRASSVAFSKPYEVAAIVLLADGENTESKFSVTVKDLSFE